MIARQVSRRAGMSGGGTGRQESASAGIGGANGTARAWPARGGGARLVVGSVHWVAP
jgi:hypothetical protein